MSEAVKPEVKLEIFDNGKNVRRENAVIVRVPERDRAPLDEACRHAGAVHRWASKTKEYAHLEISEAELRKTLDRMDAGELRDSLLHLLEHKSPPLPSLYVG